VFFEYRLRENVFRLMGNKQSSLRDLANYR